jgi:hypothetical protein
MNKTKTKTKAKAEAKTKNKSEMPPWTLPELSNSGSLSGKAGGTPATLGEAKDFPVGRDLLSRAPR